MRRGMAWVGAAALGLVLVVLPVGAAGAATVVMDPSPSAGTAPSEAPVVVAEIVPAVGGGGGAASVLSLSGDPLVYHFDTTVLGDSVEGLWTLANSAGEAVLFDGVMAPVGEVSRELEARLVVEYGVVGASGEVERWAAAGTLASPVSYTAATGASPTMVGLDEITIPVRVTFDGDHELGTDDGYSHLVSAEFNVSYLAGAGTGAGSGLLASTGANLVFWLVVAVTTVAIGTGMRRRRSTRGRG